MGNAALSEERRSPWLTMDAAHVIFTAAKRRCYINKPTSDKASNKSQTNIEAEQDAGWDVLDELEGVSERVSGSKQSSKEDNRPTWEKEYEGRPWWLPDGVEAVLEEPPKWGLLADVLYEIETLINDNPSSSRL